MLSIDKYSDTQNNQLTYSEEGFLGSFAGWIIGAVTFGSVFGRIGTGILGGAAELQAQKIKGDIKTISERIAKIRNGMIDEEVKKGVKLPKSIKKISYIDVIEGVAIGAIFGPFYGVYKGSQLQGEYEILLKKMEQLETLLKSHGIDPAE